MREAAVDTTGDRLVQPGVRLARHHERLDHAPAVRPTSTSPAAKPSHRISGCPVPAPGRYRRHRLGLCPCLRRCRCPCRRSAAGAAVESAALVTRLPEARGASCRCSSRAYQPSCRTARSPHRRLPHRRQQYHRLPHRRQQYLVCRTAGVRLGGLACLRRASGACAPSASRLSRRAPVSRRNVRWSLARSSTATSSWPWVVSTRCRRSPRRRVRRWPLPALRRATCPRCSAP